MRVLSSSLLGCVAQTLLWLAILMWSVSDRAGMSPLIIHRESSNFHQQPMGISWFSSTIFSCMARVIFLVFDLRIYSWIYWGHMQTEVCLSKNRHLPKIGLRRIQRHQIPIRRHSRSFVLWPPYHDSLVTSFWDFIRSTLFLRHFIDFLYTFLILIYVFMNLLIL